MKIAYSLRTARVQKRLTQAQLAYIADITQPALSLIENGKTRPSEETKHQLEQILGPIDWALTFDERQVSRQILTN